MHIHYIQHVEFEGLGCMEQYFHAEGHDISSTKLYQQNGALPEDISGIDLLIILGGPMSVHDEQIYPWLVDEKLWLKQLLQHGIRVLGICLGAQLLAEVLGATVVHGQQREIGWYNIYRQPEASIWNGTLPEKIQAFHWHGETFNLPLGASLLYSSEACKHQAFFWKEQVLALQFHLEMTPLSAASLCQNCSDELVNTTKWVQSQSEMLENKHNYTALNQTMYLILQQMLR